jgi:hypothetical protein
MESYLNPIEPGSFGGVQTLSRQYGVQNAKDWLMKQDAYTLHKPSRLRFKRRKTLSRGIDDLWQADHADVSSLSRYNDSHRYLLTCIDVFSKKARVVPLKSKTGVTIREAFATMITDVKPKLLQTDKGSEFLNSTFQQFLKENNIRHYTSENEDIKCSVVERWNRTLKTKMWRYFTHAATQRYLDVLPALVESYNNSYHRSIKMTPNQVTAQNEVEVRKRLYPAKESSRPRWKFDVGEQVRLCQARRAFKKGYLPNWTEEVFVISSRYATDPPTYAIKDYDGEKIAGKFYAEELQKVVKDDTFKVEEIIKTRKRGGKTEYFVKWLGYPVKFNSWVDNISG